MPPWTDAGPVDDLPEGQRRCTTLAGKPVILFHQGGKLRAVQNICPHAGLPLADGELRGRVLTCPFHGYSYDIATGRNVDFPHEEPPVRTYPVRVQAGRIEVDLTPNQAKP